MGTKLFQWANPQKDQETIDAEKLIEEQRKKQDAAKDEPIDNPNAERTTPAK